MTKKILTSLDLRGDILINGTANSTSGYVLTSNGAGTLSWAAASGGGSGFTGAGTSITGVTGTNATGTGTVTSTALALTGGSATTTSGTLNATSGNLTIKSGDATGNTTIGTVTSGDLILDVGAASAANGSPLTGSVVIGGTNSQLTKIDAVAAGSVSIGSTTGTLNVAIGVGGSATTGAGNVIILGTTGNQTKTVSIATGNTVSNSSINIGAQATVSKINNLGQSFFWQPTPILKSGAGTISYGDIQAQIININVAFTGNLALPSGTNMDNIQSTYVDMALDWSVINNQTGVVTITAGTSHTLVGTGIIAANSQGRFRSRRTASTTWITYRIG
jgi:hypothetical protein